MGNNRGSRTAKSLDERGSGALNLVGAGLAAQLQNSFGCLIDPGRRKRKSACLVAAQGQQRQFAFGRQVIILQPAPALAARGQTAGFNGQRPKNGIGVPKLEQIDRIPFRSRLRQCFLN